MPVRLLPDRGHPTSRGYACAKGTRFLEVARAPDRLLRPRVHGRPTSWSAATDTIATKPVIQAFPDFAHCELAIVLGSNPYVSQSSFIHLGRAQRSSPGAGSPRTG